MTPTAHTPGPYECRRPAHDDQSSYSYIDIFSARTGKWIATVHNNKFPEGQEEADANGVLLAAAPDLLEALEVILAHAKPGALAHGLEASASAAIRKARGEGA